MNGAGNKAMARHGAEWRGSVQGDKIRARPAKSAGRRRGQAQEGAKEGCCRTPKRCGPGLWTPDGCGRGQTEGMPEAGGELTRRWRGCCP